MNSSWLDIVSNDAAVERIARALHAGGGHAVRGSVGASTPALVMALHIKLQRPLLLITAHLDEADEAVEMIQSQGIAAGRFPAVEVAPGESGINLELLAERLTLVKQVLEQQGPAVIVAPIQALMQSVPSQARLGRMLRTLRVGDQLDTTELAAWLNAAGYSRVEAIDSPGEFAVRGGIVDVFPPGASPARIDLFGTSIDAMYEIDLDTMGSDRRIEAVTLVGATIESLHAEQDTSLLITLLPRQTVGVLAEVIEITEQGRSYFDRAVDARGISGPPAVFKAVQEHFAARLEVSHFSAGAAAGQVFDLDLQPIPTFAEEASQSVPELAELARTADVIVPCQSAAEAQRMKELADQFTPGAPIRIVTDYVHRGFIWNATAARPTAIVPYHELMHRYFTRRSVKRLSSSRALDTFLELQVGDLVVHQEHGISRFIGLQTLRTNDVAQEFLTLEFAGGTKLHVPTSQIDLVQKYVGATKGQPELSVIGGRKWKNQKEKVAEAVRELAAQMLRIQAARESLPGIRYPADTPWQKEFEAEFPYEETEDQLSAINAVKRDMGDAKPMDRLICGDVGFGKTEIAIRAAFKAAEFGKQVAVLVPTTVLSEQHDRTFHARFADYPFRIASLSRFKTAREQKDVIDQVRRGQIDIVIGTHRLLSKDVRFADLGMVIVDEEQRFGVEHKQRLLEFRLTADVLTLSATPIPRTLHMAMLGLRDISSLTTPPLDRRAIVTEVTPYNPQRIKQAIQRELAREGQVFFVHNRVHNIRSVADDVQKLAPDARVIIGHGQMPTGELEQVMLKFIRREADILVCTTIIESGIDIPTVNTMLINDAHRFGLSELHQLRGRVGRYKHRAYCYLLLPTDQPITDVAVKRLKAIESFSMLGAGFKIALRDLEIRGAGNLLGAEQSGHIAAVGYEMYCQLLEQAVNDLKNEPRIQSAQTSIDIGIVGAIPKGYIPSDMRRMDAYRRISRATSRTELEQVQKDIVSAYGELPKNAGTLLQVAELRVSAAAIGVRSISRHDDDVIIRTERPGEVERLMSGAAGSLRMVGQPDSQGLTDIYFRPPKNYLDPESLLAILRRRLTGQHAAHAVQTI